MSALFSVTSTPTVRTTIIRMIYTIGKINIWQIKLLQVFHIYHMLNLGFTSTAH